MRKALFLNRHCTLLPSNMAAGQTEISGKYPVRRTSIVDKKFVTSNVTAQLGV